MYLAIVFMKKNLLVASILASVLSCKDNDPIEKSKDVAALHAAFHGRYHITNAVTSEPIDIDMDGFPSTDLLIEMPVLRPESMGGYFTRISIFGASEKRNDPTFIFTQSWPEQYIRLSNGKVWDGLEMIPFDPANSFDFSTKVVSRQLTFSENLEEMIVTPDESEQPIFRQSSPKRVIIEDDGKITVIADRRIYTRTGVKQVTVTLTYERFSMDT